jgi:NHL repeat
MSTANHTQTIRLIPRRLSSSVISSFGTFGSAKHRTLMQCSLSGLLTLAICLWLIGGNAWGATGVGIVGHFGEGDGTPFGVTVDPNTGEPYTSTPESSFFRILQFNRGSELVAFFGSGPTSGLVVDASTVPSNLIAIQASTQMIQSYKLREFGAELTGEFSVSGSANTSGPFAGTGQTAVAPAVDSAGTVYFPNQPNNEVQEFTSSGAPGPIPRITGEGEHALNAPTGVAVAPDGRIYVADTSPGTGEGRVEEFNALGEFQSVLDSEDSDAVGVDPANGDVWVVDGQPEKHAEYVHVYDSSGSLLATSTPSSFAVEGEDQLSQVLEIGVSGASHDAYVADRGAGSWKILAVGSAPSEVATGTPTEVQGNSATATGEVDPGGSATEYWFAYNTNGSCEGERESEHRKTGEGVTKEDVTGKLSGLAPNTQYTVCLVAENAFGEEKGAPVTLVTPASKPAIVSESVAELRQTNVELRAQVNPNNEETTYGFQYGVDPTLGEHTEMAGAGPLVGFSSEGDPVSFDVQTVQPNTTYFYRAVATNATGTQDGAIQTFTTPPPLPLGTTGAASAITDVSAAVSGTVDPGSSGHSVDEARYAFEYGPCVTPATCASSPYPSATPEGSAGEGLSDVPETASLTGLQPNTIYHYRVVVTNDNGSGVTRGVEQTLITLPLAPDVDALGPVSLTPTSALLVMTVTTQGVNTTYEVDYGTSESYGMETPAPGGEVGASEGGQVVTVELLGLGSGMTYHYRVVASNAGGMTSSGDATFTTPAVGLSPGAPQPGFSLTGTAPAGPGALVYPNLTSLVPATPAEATTTTKKGDRLARAQKLARALAGCKRDVSRKKRQTCVKHAKKKYATDVKGKKK